MKKLTELDTQQYSYEDTKDGEKLPTYRELMRIGLGRVAPKSAEQSMNLSIVLRKLRAKEDFVELENEEFKVAKDILGANEVKMFQVSHGPLMDWLTACEKASDKKPELEVK